MSHPTSDIDFSAINRESAPKQIAARIKESIRSGKLGILDKLPTEDELAASFGVSRPTIRETLKYLAAQNLVEARRGPSGGTFIKVPTPFDIQNKVSDSLMMAASLDLFTFEEVVASRYMMGELCCRAAAENWLPGDIDDLRIEVEIQRNEKLTDVEFCASDVRFHSALARATHNTIVAALASGAIEGLEPITNLVLYRFRAREILANQHQRLIDCLVERDVDGMIRILQEQKVYLVEKHNEAKDWRVNKKSKSPKK